MQDNSLIINTALQGIQKLSITQLKHSLLPNSPLIRCTVHFRPILLQFGLKNRVHFFSRCAAEAADSPGDSRVAYTFTCAPGLSVNWMRSWFKALSRT